METILKAENVSKRFFKKQALRGINLELKAGHILGLMGPNGSGKTTLLKIAQDCKNRLRAIFRFVL